MPKVTIIELCRDMGNGTGEGVWVEVEFSSGRVVTLRLDEQGIYDTTVPMLFARVEDENHGQYISLKGD